MTVQQESLTIAPVGEEPAESATTVGSPREWFHLYFPARERAARLDVLLAGDACQRTRALAAGNQECRFVAVHGDPEVVDSLKAMKVREATENVEVLSGGPAEVEALGCEFDLIFVDCSLGRASDLDVWLRSLREVLGREGSLHLKVPGTYGRQGLNVLRQLSAALGIPPGDVGREAAQELISAVTESNRGESGELEAAAVVSDRRLLDQMTQPVEAAFAVEESIAALERNGYFFQRFLYQAHYLPEASRLALKPELLADVCALKPSKQWALMELYRGTMACHEMIACRTDRPIESAVVDLAGCEWLRYVPELSPLVEGEFADLPPGAVMRVRCRGHAFREISVLLNETQTALCGAIDGRRTGRELVDLLDAEMGQEATEYVGHLLRSLWRFDYCWFRT
jgi:hypothetical protein